MKPPQPDYPNKISGAHHPSFFDAFLLSLILVLTLISSASLAEQKRKTISLNGEWEFKPVFLDESDAKRTAKNFLRKIYPEKMIKEQLPRIISGQIKLKSLPLQVQKDIETAYKIFRNRLGDQLEEMARIPPSALDEKIIVPSFWTFEKDFGYPPEWTKAQAAWYGRSFSVPEEMRGMPARMRFDGVSCKATVLVNGKPAGNHVGGFTPFELDVTELIRFGQKNTLMVYVQDVTAVVNEAGKYTAPAAESESQRGIWQNVSLNFYPKIYIDDMVVETSVRESAIKVNVLIHNATYQEVEISLEGEVKGCMTFSNKMIRIKPKAEKWVTFRKGWAYPVYWSPSNPHLYTLDITLEANDFPDQKLKDERSVRFGFREFWTDGKYFMLNGKRINLRGDCINRIPNAFVLTPEYIKSFFRAAREANINTLRLHTSPFPEFILDLADETGMLIIDESAVTAHHVYDFSNMTHFKSFYREWVSRDRNHPSVIMWSSDNELGMFHKDTKTREAANRICGFIRQYDKTRPIKAEGSGDLWGAADVFDVHYPHEDNLPDLFLALLGAESKSGLGRLHYNGQTWRGNKPITAGEFGPMFYAPPERLSFLGGEEVYAGIFSGAEKYNRAIGRFYGIQIRAMRHLGFAHLSPWSTLNFGLKWLKIDVANPRFKLSETTIDGMSPRRIIGHYSFVLNPGLDPSKPFIQPTSIYHEIKKAFEPTALFFMAYNRSFYEKTEIELPYTLFNDTQDVMKCTIVHELIQRDGIKQIKVETVNIGPGYSKAGIIPLRTPETQERDDILLRSSVFDGRNNRLLSEEYPFSVFQKTQLSKPIPKLAELNIGLYDKNGSTAKVLDTLGIRYIGFNHPNFSDADLIIVGKNSLCPEIDHFLRHYIREGGKGIILDQNPVRSLDWLSVKAYPNAMKRATGFKLAEGHPVFGGVRKVDLCFWGKDYLICNGSYLKPSSGYFKSLMEVGGRDGLDYTPLIEVWHGKGAFILSQLLLIDKFFEEPAATMLFRNILSYVAELNVERKPETIFLLSNRINGPFVEFLHKQFGAVQAVRPKEFEKPISKLIIIDAKSLDWENLKRKKKVLTESLKEGAEIIVNGLTPDSCRYFNEIFGMNLALTRTALMHPQVEKTSSEKALWGISNDDLIWDRVPVDFVAHSKTGTTLIKEPLKTTTIPQEMNWGDALRFAQAGAKKIDNPGAALIKIPYGKGRILVNQILPLTSNTKAGRYFSTLITNELLGE